MIIVVLMLAVVPVSRVALMQDSQLYDLLISRSVCEYDGKLLVAIRTKDIYSYNQYEQLRNAIYNEYADEQFEVYVSRDLDIWYRIEKINSGDCDTEYIRETFELVKQRNTE